LKSLIFILLFTTNVFANDFLQFSDYGIKAGAVYGGPIPTKSLSNLDASPLLAPNLGIYYNYQFSENISLHSELTFTMKGASFNTSYRRDTLAETEIEGQKGTVPTFYTALINGDMSVIYLEIPIFFSYDISEDIKMSIGVQPSFIIGGKNDINARVIVGEGGFYDDIKRYYDNMRFLNFFDFALCLRGFYNISETFSIGLYGSRAITPLYKDSFKTDPSLETGKMYNTQITGSLYYRL
jgi:hypothetical protein